MVYADNTAYRADAGTLQKPYFKVFQRRNDGGLFTGAGAFDTFVSVQGNKQYFIYDSILSRERVFVLIRRDHHDNAA